MPKFEYEFEFEPNNVMSMDYSEEDDEYLDLIDIGGDQVMIVGNKSGLITLAKVCIKIALGDYDKGFHIHISKNFDADHPDIFAVGVDRSKE